MIRRFYQRLPGPTPVRVLQMILVIALALTLLIVLFEWAGQFLDTGGVVG